MTANKVIEVYLTLNQLKTLLAKQRILIRDPMLHVNVTISANDRDVDILIMEMRDAPIDTSKER
jgi:hypothetical protein